MARQNIDEDWKTDPRRRALSKKLGCDRLADGMRVEINWLILDHKGNPVPLKKFKFIEDYQAWLDCGLAEIKGDVVEIAGASRYAEFFEKQAQNGSKGGRPKKEETQNNPEKPKITQIEKVETQKKPEKPSSSFSISVSKKNINTNTNTLQPAAAETTNPVSVYCEAYKARYKHNPVIGGKQAGQLQTFARNHPHHFAELIRGYLLMPDSWAVQRSHPVDLLETKVNEVVRFLETGKVVTKKVVQHAEELIDKHQGTNKKPRRSIEDLEAEREQMIQESKVVALSGRRE